MADSDFIQALNSGIEQIRADGLYRRLRVIDSPQGRSISWNGRNYLNFSSNDYLGLAGHPQVVEGAAEAVRKYGAGSGASRLVCGSFQIHEELESRLAEFKGTEVALLFSSGYAAAIGTICSLLGPDDLLVSDKLNHASLVDAARLSRAQVEIFPHNDLDQLNSILKMAVSTGKNLRSGHRRRILIVTESIFSMDGDAAPLREMVELKEKYGAWLMVDEAHATGLYGNNRRGRIEELGLSDRVEIQLGTLSKAIGSSGGFICGPSALREWLINKARSFIFSTAPNPAASGAAIHALEIIGSEEGSRRVSLLWQNVKQLRDGLKLPFSEVQSAIMPLILGAEAAAISAMHALLENGIFIPAIRYPSVPRGSARLRITMSSQHLSQDINLLLGFLENLLQKDPQA